MDAKVPIREEAFALLKKYKQPESLIKHALAVEASCAIWPASGVRMRKSGASSA